MSRIQYHDKANPGSRVVVDSRVVTVDSRNRVVRSINTTVVHKYPAEAELILNGPVFGYGPDIHVLEWYKQFKRMFHALTMLCHFRFAVIFEWSRDVLPVLCSAGIGGIVTNTSSAVLECSKIFLFSPPASCIFLIRRHKQKIIHTLNMV